MTRRLFLLLALLGAPAAHADEVLAEIRFAAAEGGPVWVGEKRELHLELWSNGMSFSGQWFVLPEVPGGFLMQTDNSTVNLSENRGEHRGSDLWQGLRYTFQLYSQRAGHLVVPSFDVRFSSREAYGSPDRAFEFSTPVLDVESVLPPGVEPGGLLVSSTDFSMEAEWSPPLNDQGGSELKVGDALTLHVKRRAADVPGMVFAPLPVPKIEGLGVYPGSPDLDDRVARGSLTGTRGDSITFVCESPGTFELPEFTFQWWDPQRESLSSSVIPAVSVSVAENPAWSAAYSVSADSAGSRRAWYLAGGLALLALLLVYLLRRFGPELQKWRDERKMVYEASEAWAFSQVQKACDAGNAPAAYNAISAWLTRYRPQEPVLTLSQLAAESGDVKLQKETAGLQQAVSSGGSVFWQGQEMAAALVRVKSLRGGQEGEAAALLPLNPRSFR